MQAENKENFITKFLQNSNSLIDVLFIDSPKTNITFDLQQSEQMIKKLMVNKLVKEIQTVYLNGLLLLHLFLNQPVFQTSLTQPTKITEEWQSILLTKEVASMIYQICVKLPGSYLTNKLSFRLLRCLIEISTHQYKGQKNYEQVMEELEMQKNVLNISDILDNFVQICYERGLLQTMSIQDDKVKTINILMEIFSNCASQEEQLLVFLQKSPEIINQLIQMKENQLPSFKFIELVISFLRTLIFQTHYVIQYEVRSENNQNNCKVGHIYFNDKNYNDSTENTESDQTKTYETSVFCDPKLNEINKKFLIAIYPLSRKILTFIFTFLYTNIKNHSEKNDQLESPEIIHQYFEKKYEKARYSLFKILQINFEFHAQNMQRPNVQANLDDICLKLQKLLEIYEKGLKLDPTNYKPPLELLKFLHTISQQHPTEPFYTRIMTPYPLLSDIITKLTSNDLIQINRIRIDKLNLKMLAFPLSVTIQAGKQFQQIFEVWKYGSVIHWAFASKGKDIGFKLVYLGAFDGTNARSFILLFCCFLVFLDLQLPYIILDQTKIFCQYQPVKGTFYAELPGLYQIVFDNSYSWIHEKQIRFRLFVLENIHTPAHYLYPFYQIDSIQLELQNERDRQEQLENQKLIFEKNQQQQESKEEKKLQINELNQQQEKEVKEIKEIELEEQNCEIIIYFQDKVSLIFKFKESVNIEELQVNSNLWKQQIIEQNNNQNEQENQNKDYFAEFCEEMKNKIQEFKADTEGNYKFLFQLNIINLPEQIDQSEFEKKLKNLIKEETITALQFHEKFDLIL